MGSGRSGLYPSISGEKPTTQNQSGGAKSMHDSSILSKRTLKHAVTGSFTKTSNRLKSGGHGQEGIKELERRKIKYVIEKTFRNGVRLGYVPDHYEKRRRSLDNNQIGQLWFPENWTKSDIRRAGIAVLHSHEGLVKDGSTITGWYNNVKVGIVVRNHKIKTIFPTKEQE